MSLALGERLGAKVMQCRIGVGAGCSLKARTPRPPPSDTPVQNQACIPRVRMAVRYPGPPLPRPLSEPFRRGDESPLWMGPDVYAGTLHASPLHPYQRGGHPLSSGYWIGGAWSGWTFCVWKSCQSWRLVAGRACRVYHPARINPAPRFPSRPLEYLYHPARIDPALRASAPLSALYHIARINPAPRRLARLLMVGAQSCCWFIHTPAVELIGGLLLPRFLDSAKSLEWVPYDITALWRVACYGEESHRGGGRCGFNPGWCFCSG